MPLPDLPPDDITADALRRALADGEREGIRAEFKLMVGTDDSAKAEWCLDVTSFSNTAGGVLLIGAEDTEGRLTALPGLPGNIDDEIQRLESILRDRVDPSMPGVSILPLEVDGTTVLVVSVARSWRAPHLVRSKSKWQVARRNSSGKYVLQDSTELRAVFAEAADTGARLRRWHDDRVAEVDSKRTPVQLPDGAFITLSVQPFGAGAPGVPPVLDVAAARADDPHKMVQPLYRGGTGPRVNIDGLVATSHSSGDYEATGYAQLFREASLAYVDKAMFDKPDQGVPGTLLVEQLLSAVMRSTAAVEWAGGALPVAVLASIHGVSGWPFHTSRSKRSFDNLEFDRDHIFLPSVTIERQLHGREETALAIRPLLDGLWNAVGVAACEHFGADGEWVPPR